VAINGVKVIGMHDTDLVKENQQLQARIEQYETEFGTIYDGHVIENDVDGCED
jgi:hypothetical protein